MAIEINEKMYALIQMCDKEATLVKLENLKPNDVANFYVDETSFYCHSYLITSTPFINKNGLLAVYAERLLNENYDDLILFMRLLTKDHTDKSTFCYQCPIKSTFAGGWNEYKDDPVCTSTDGACHCGSKECMIFVKRYLQSLIRKKLSR